MQVLLRTSLLWLWLVGAAVAGPALMGTWSGVADGQPITVTFAGNGNGTVNGAPMYWQLRGNLLFIEQGGDVLTYEVGQVGDRLQVSGGAFSSVVTLSRGNAAVVQPAAAEPAPGTAAELVGKWCRGGSFSATGGGGSSSMSCFELKADGTYTYEHEGSMSAQVAGAWAGTASSGGDAGQWSVAGNRLLSRSAGGESGNYLLEKRNNPKTRDPMLCLDGDCYTTYWQKPPW